MPNVPGSLGHLLNTRHCDAMLLLERQRVVCGFQGNDRPLANGHGLQIRLEVQLGWLIRKRALQPAEIGRFNLAAFAMPESAGSEDGFDVACKWCKRIRSFDNPCSID